MISCLVCRVAEKSFRSRRRLRAFISSEIADHLLRFADALFFRSVLSAHAPQPFQFSMPGFRVIPAASLRVRFLFLPETRCSFLHRRAPSSNAVKLTISLATFCKNNGRLTHAGELSALQ
jgi:hypothetical protein